MTAILATEVEAGGSGGQKPKVHPWLRSKFEARLRQMRTCLKEETKTKQASKQKVNRLKTTKNLEDEQHGVWVKEASGQEQTQQHFRKEGKSLCLLKEVHWSISHI